MPYSAPFLRVCRAYPNKAARWPAWLVWVRLRRDHSEAQLEDLSLEAIAREIKTERWIKNNGEFVPHLRTWLHGRRFADEPGTPTKPRTTGWVGVHDGEYPDGEQKI